MSLVLCPSCGFLYSNPRPSAETMEHHYRHSGRASGAVWHAHGPGSRHELFSAFRSGFVSRVVGTPATEGDVLDVGCSQGDLLTAYDLPGWRRFGLEPSATAAAKARERGIRVSETTLEDNEYITSSFDLVTCWSVLEHVWDVRKAMVELVRLVKRGGHLVLCVPNSAAPVAMISEFFSYEHLSHFTRGSFLRLAQSLGLTPVQFEVSKGSGLVFGLRNDGVEATRNLPIPDDREELLAAVERYKQDRENLEREVRARFHTRLEAWHLSKARIALFGAGEHSQFLLDLFDFEDRLVCMLDSDPAKKGGSFLSWDIFAPTDLPKLDLDAVIISSRPFQEEMAAAIEPLAEAHGVEVVRCYPEEREIAA